MSGGVFFLFLLIAIIAVVDAIPLRRGCRQSSMDVFFLMDSSSSIQTENFADQLKFVADVINNLDMKMDGIHAGLATFSDSFYLSIDLTHDRNSFLSSMSSVFPLSGSTRIGRALTYLKREGFGSPLARKNATKIAILITDGESVDNPFPIAEELKTEGVKIFAIEAKQVNNKGELRLIANKPSYRFLLKLDARNVGDAIAKTISKIGCNSAEIRDNCQQMQNQDFRFLIDLAGFGRLKSNQIMEFTIRAVRMLERKQLNCFFGIHFSSRPTKFVCLLILPLKTVCLRSLRLVVSASQRKTLSISEQLELIDDVKVKKLKLAAAAKKYGIGYSTAAKILKKKDDLRSCMQMNGNTNRKRKRQSVHKDVNEALTQWFTQACAHGATVTDHVIRQKASQLAVNLEVDFEPSNGWLMRWKQADNVSFKKFHGESTSADHGSANEWVTNVLPQLFRGYDPKDVWNCDETGIFYKAMPSGSLRFAGDEQSNGTKVPKDRLTMLQFTNMDGTWMTSQLFTDVMKTLDRKMFAQNRKIILFLDNATCHNLLPGSNLSNIKLSFMPPNTTSLIQPLDQGIIRSFKAYYRRELVRMQIAAIHATPPVPLSEVAKQITVLKAMHMMKRALFMV
ncbi:unnamed protein product [Acanthosepion pharaonis]|uniref:Uncharacterized protein n=1 Tax=Acanthosepion pharaonis TaxID=158019 RepID=A0A812B1H7_ACAPH|nr:unnamed protein product [Sepia pharaonis]